MVTLYGIPNCDSIKKARKWLAEANIDYQFHDLRKDGLSKQQLVNWESDVGWETLLNRRGLTWRKVPDAVKATMHKDAALDLMLEQPAIIKRPVLDTGQQRFIGFNPEHYQSIFNLKDI
ncbi:MAG: ArsC family reductase [Gammaproteobacteria bacterium]|nr:ArsC family reductase [Gammaproteobacteria bacterium]